MTNAPPTPPPQNVGVSISGAVGVANDIVGGDKVTVTIGSSVDELIAAMESRGYIRRAQDAGLERTAVIALAQRLNPKEALDFDRAVAELRNAVDIAVGVVANGTRGAADDGTHAVLSRVAVLTQQGELDRGARALDDALEALGRVDEERRRAFERSRARLLEAGVAQDILRHDAPAAARRLQALAALDGPSGAFDALKRRYDQFFDEGASSGVRFSLEVAGEVARAMLAQAPDDDHREIADFMLGNALLKRAELESGTDQLREALVAYERVLKVRSRERAPIDWANAMSNRGAALTKLGEREGDARRFDDAVSSLLDALSILTLGADPQQWAMAQINLGNALVRLGERDIENGRLERAVVAFQQALAVLRREGQPKEWASAQNSLGAALQSLSERENGTARVQQAVAAYRAGLEVRTRAAAPMSWAGTQNNLGTALWTWGRREIGTARLLEAVEAYRAALSEWTRERAPLQWAMAQSNLGNALTALGEREVDGAGRLADAIAAYHAALEVRNISSTPREWATTQNNLGLALKALGDKEQRASRYEEAIAAYQRALQVRTRESGLRPWTTTQNNLKAAMIALQDYKAAGG